MRNFVSSLVALTACAGATPAPSNFVSTGSGSGGGGAAGKPGGPADVTIELSASDKFGDIKGVYFEPEALGQPGMPMTPPKKKMTIDKHRAEITKAKDPVVKQAEAAIVATMLYERSKSESGDAQKKTRDEARQTLRDVLVAVGNKDADPTVLRMLGSYELLFEDNANAEKAWGALVAAEPKDKDVNVNRAWWMYTLLKQGKNAEAVAAIGDAKVTEKTPELAYATAWAKWRTGDNAGAWQAIVMAAKGWGAMANRDVVEHDLMLFAGRTGIGMQQALPDLQALLGKAPDQVYKIDSDLGLKAYQFAGRWADGIGALDAALAAGGAKTPPEDVPTIRFYQATFSIPVDDPAATAKYAKQALDALGTCGAKCDKDKKANLVGQIYGFARLFHLQYATSNDTRYQQPALDLYNATVDLVPDPTKASADRDSLQRFIKVMKPNDGTHSKDELNALLQRHNQEVQACYEQFLSANGKLAGALVINLESDQTGGIKGVSSEPKAGQAEMAGVAGCVVEHAKKWKLPTRGRPGSTRVKLTYALSKRG
jgi:hypothetical protein